MSLLLSHLLSLFFCWLKFDFHHPSTVISPSPYPLLTSPTLSPTLNPFLSLQGSFYQKSSEAKDQSDFGNSCEFFFLSFHFFLNIISTFILMSVSYLHWQVLHKEFAVTHSPR